MKNARLRACVDVRENQKPQGERTRLRLDASKETNQIVATFHLREARSIGQVWRCSWLSLLVVPPFLILDDIARILLDGDMRVKDFCLTACRSRRSVPLMLHTLLGSLFLQGLL